MEFFTSFTIGFIFGSVICASYVYFKLRSELFKNNAELQLLKETARSQEKLEQQFELVASKILEEKAHKVSDQNLKNLSLVLDPLKDKLREFEKRVEDAYGTERAERGNLRGELTKLIELNLKMSQEAHNLTKALKGDVKTQGNWGEMILENILERSGLRKGEEYTVQGNELSLKNDEGQSIKPDVIVHLPENKHIIVDSKVSLLAYEAYSQADSEIEKDKFAKAHVDSLKKHIDGLSAKKYSSSDKLITPDFVILFMPIEPAFALAFRIKPELLQYAWDRNIALVSPTTLLTSLRTVATIWKQELRKKNAEEIAQRGGLLYDKFVGMIEDFAELGKKLDSAQKSHEQVMGKLQLGSGNLISQVEKLKELGAKTNKKIPELEI